MVGAYFIGLVQVQDISFNAESSIGWQWDVPCSLGVHGQREEKGRTWWCYHVFPFYQECNFPTIPTRLLSVSSWQCPGPFPAARGSFWYQEEEGRMLGKLIFSWLHLLWDPVSAQCVLSPWVVSVYVDTYTESTSLSLAVCTKNSNTDAHRSQLKQSRDLKGP